MNAIWNNIPINVFPFSDSNESSRTIEIVISEDESAYDNTKWNNFQTKGLHCMFTTFYYMIKFALCQRKSDAAAIDTNLTSTVPLK